MSRWTDIYDHLKAKGYSVYAPSQKTGECKSKYVVVRGAGVNLAGRFSSTRALYDILLYVPYNKYGSIEPEVANLKNAMKDLFPMMRPTGNETPPFPDDTVKGFMVSVEYENYRKL